MSIGHLNEQNLSGVKYDTTCDVPEGMDPVHFSVYGTP